MVAEEIQHDARTVEEIVDDMDLFDDGSHIVYVNGSYKGDDAVGRLMHDFGCKESKDIYYSELAKGVKHFKEEEGGRKAMCEAVERYAERKAAVKVEEERSLIVKASEVRRLGTGALVKALGPIGMVRYLEGYNNGGRGDYTKEKYDQPDDPIEDILAMAGRL